MIECFDFNTREKVIKGDFIIAFTAVNLDHIALNMVIGDHITVIIDIIGMFKKKKREECSGIRKEEVREFKFAYLPCFNKVTLQT